MLKQCKTPTYSSFSLGVFPSMGWTATAHHPLCWPGHLWLSQGVEQNGHSDLDSSAPEGLCDPGRAHRVKNRLLVGQQNWGLDAWNMKRCDTSILKIILLAVDWPFILSKFHFFVDWEVIFHGKPLRFGATKNSPKPTNKLVWESTFFPRGKPFEPYCNSDSTKIFSCLPAGFTGSSRF